MRRSTDLRARRAFTLVELVIAGALMAILLVGLQSAVLIASKAIPKPTEGSDVAAQASALDRLALDVSYAKSITSVSATQITFTVSDRNNDGTDDSIVYSWSATAGDPLIRRANSYDAETILPGVTSLALSLSAETVAGAPVYVESSETLLGTYSTSSNLADWTVNSTTWTAQTIPVTLPADAVDYRVTRLRLSMRQSGATTGVTGVSLRVFRGGLPTTRELATAAISESGLSSSNTMVSTPLVSTRQIDRTESIGIVIRPTSNAPSSSMSYRSNGSPTTAGTWSSSANSGGAWTTTAGRSLLYELWGPYRTYDSRPSIRRGTFLLVRIESRGNAPLELNLPLLSRPEIIP